MKMTPLNIVYQITLSQKCEGSRARMHIKADTGPGET